MAMPGSVPNFSSTRRGARRFVAARRCRRDRVAVPMGFRRSAARQLNSFVHVHVAKDQQHGIRRGQKSCTRRISPSNAVLLILGDVDVDEGIKLAERTSPESHRDRNPIPPTSTSRHKSTSAAAW